MPPTPHRTTLTNYTSKQTGIQTYFICDQFASAPFKSGPTLFHWSCPVINTDFITPQKFRQLLPNCRFATNCKLLIHKQTDWAKFTVSPSSLTLVAGS